MAIMIFYFSLQDFPFLLFIFYTFSYFYIHACMWGFLHEYEQTGVCGGMQRLEDLGIILGCFSTESNQVSPLIVSSVKPRAFPHG